jgi:hypothetical protein
MSIKLVTCFYNEAFLIPFYLRHYHFADAITALVTPSDDETEALLRADPRVTVEVLQMPLGIDDELKSATLHTALWFEQQHDWIILADADEFVWPPDDPGALTVGAYLASVPDRDDVLMAHMAHVYRSATDADLDPTLIPIGNQRRHGREHLSKPIIIRQGRRIHLRPGNHDFRSTHQTLSALTFAGAHWANADPAFTVTRRVRDRGARISPTNRLMRHGTHHWDVTAAEVIADLESHRDDAPLF